MSAGALRRVLDIGVPRLVMAALVVGWEAAHRAGLLPGSVASPAQIWTELTESYNLLWRHARPTLSSAVWGFAAAVLIAFALALVVAFVPKLNRTVYTSAVLVASVPLIALTPILVLWLQRGAQVRITIAAIASFFPILIGCIEGLRQVRHDQAELFEVLSAPRWQRILRLQIPSAVPLTVAGLRAAAAGAVLGAIIAEWSGGGGALGLGALMSSALFSFNVPLTWLTITAAVVLSVGAYFVVMALTVLMSRKVRRG